MTKRYRPIDLGEMIDSDEQIIWADWFHNNDEFMVAILSWLAIQLNKECATDFDAIEFEVMKRYGKFGGAYPTLGIFSDTIEFFDETYKSVEKASNRLLRQASAMELTLFWGQSDKDWSEEIKKLLE